MRGTLNYAIVLAAGLILLSVIGNLQVGDPHLLSVIPKLYALLPYPIVLSILLLLKRRSDPEITVGRLMRIGNDVVLPAALVFSVFYTGFQYYYFENFRPLSTAIAAAMGFAATWVTGMVFTLLIAWIVMKMASSS